MATEEAIGSATEEAIDFASCKRTEHKYQNAKYAGHLSKMGRPFDLKRHERQFFRPPHLGGDNLRGLLYAKTVEQLPKDIRGLKILDYACGTGFLAVYLASLGAEVTAIDASESAIDCTLRRAKTAGVKVNALVMDCEHLGFPDAHFDIVIGLEALHHVIIYPRMPAELHRVMKPQGFAVFGENWGGENPALQAARENTSMKRARSDERGEVMLGAELLKERMGALFESRVEAFGIVSLLKKYAKKKHATSFLLKNRLVMSLLWGIDQLLEPITPSWVCGESVIVLRRR